MKKFLLPLFSSLLLLILVLGGCSTSLETVQNGPKTETRTTQTENLPQAKASGIVELKDGDSYDLTAEYVNKEINGNVYKMLAYNGSIPGPTLKVPQGAKITLNLINETDIPTSLHSHGVRLDSQYDGVVYDAGSGIAPGKSFAYKIKFPDAGMFWYHPHLYEYFAQSNGLYGNYLVVPKDSTYWSPVNEEVPLMLNDLLIKNGKIDAFNDKYSEYALMGKFGNVMFVNGDANYRRTFKQGEVVRFYITNASNTRVYDLSIPDAKLKLVGSDNGKYEHETWQDSVILSPSERAIIEVLFDKPGTHELQHVNPQKTYRLAVFNVTEEKTSQDFSKEFMKLRENNDVIADIDSFRSYFDKKPDKNITFNIDMGGSREFMLQNRMGQHMMPNGEMMNNSPMMDSGTETIEWEDSMAMMNEMATSKVLTWEIIDDDTKKKNMDIGWKFKAGDVVKIKIYNDPESDHPMQHTFHIHGQRFLVLSADGVKNTNLVWKDSVLVPKGSTFEILAEMQNPGTWMAHCHISEHLESGMMMVFEVE